MPEPTGQALYLTALIDSQIASFYKKRQNNRRVAIFVKLSAAGLGAMTTVLLGLQGISGTYQNWVTNIALVASALVTIIATYEGFFDHRALWVRYTQTLTSLYSLKSELGFLLAASDVPPSADSLTEIHARFQLILSATNEWWLSKRNEEQFVANKPAPKR